MSKYNINGLACEFPSCTSAQLTEYQPTPRTRLLAWQTPASVTMNLAITLQIKAMYEIGAIERPAYLIEEGRRMVYLLEYPNDTCMDKVTFWLGVFVGTRYLYLHPYAKARAEMILKADKDWDDLKYTKTYTGRRPLLDIERTHPEWGCSKLPMTPDDWAYINNTKNPCKQP